MMFPFNYFFLPVVPSLKPLRPPLLYDLMNSIVNFDQDEQTKIVDISEKARTKIFDFSYPLSNKMDKALFEKMILNHFLMRRIGYETYTAWHITLETKLNEIMPRYNILFDSLIGWNLFEDGEITSYNSTDNRTINSTKTGENNTQENSSNDVTSNSSNTLNNNSNTSATSDQRHSAMPQNAIEEVKNGQYLTDYNFDTNTGTDSSTSNGTSKNTTNTVDTRTNTNTNNENNNTTDNNTSNQTTVKNVSNKIQAYNEFMENKQNIMTMIFNDLNVLFYNLI